MMLNEIDHLPSGLLDLPAERLHEHLNGPTLIHLPGRNPQPLFVSVLLHGNEPAGWNAMRRLLRNYQPGGGARPLPRALSLFIGNTRAAAANLRHLPDQPDYNRIWPGCQESQAESAERRMMQQIVDIMTTRRPFASIDVHNNTGINPHYACINRLEPEYLHLAALFGRTLVYFVRPCGVQSAAMAQICPAVTLECGKSGQTLGEEHAAEYLNAALHLAELPKHPVAAQDIDLFHTVAVVKLPNNIDFSFDGSKKTLAFAEDLERLNFREIPAETPLARVTTLTAPLTVTDEHDRDVTNDYLKVVNAELLTRRPLMPSMLTTDANAVRQDCLCYFMERYPYP